jgi:hypothetical protein
VKGFLEASDFIKISNKFAFDLINKEDQKLLKTISANTERTDFLFSSWAQGGGGGVRLTREKVRGAKVRKAGSKIPI